MTDERPLGDHGLDLPYEANPPDTRIDLSDALVSGGVVVLAATVLVPDHGYKPALAFRFAKPDGSGFYPPLMLVADPDQLAKFKPLVYSTVNAAIAQAREQNAGTGSPGGEH